MIPGNGIDANTYASGRTHAEHSAWLDGLSDEDWMIVHAAAGVLADLAVISQIKRVLRYKMTVGDRMRLLEGMNKFAGNPLTAAAVAAVEPACDTANKMIHEALTLPVNEWRVLGRFAVFSALVKLNPSLLVALAIYRQHWPAAKPNGGAPERAAA